MANNDTVVLIVLAGGAAWMLMKAKNKKGTIKHEETVSARPATNLMMQLLLNQHAAGKGDANAKRYMTTWHHLDQMPNSEGFSNKVFRQTASKMYKQRLDEGNLFKLS